MIRPQKEKNIQADPDSTLRLNHLRLNLSRIDIHRKIYFLRRDLILFKEGVS